MKERIRKWRKPTDRAKLYAANRKAGEFTEGKKKGQPLTEYEKGLASGYLMSQSDNTGLYKYKQGHKMAKKMGLEGKEAKKFAKEHSRKIGK